MSTLHDLANKVEAAESAAAVAGIKVIQKRASEICRYKTGNLSRGIASAQISVERTNEGAEALLDSGVSYDEFVDERYQHYETAAQQTESEQRRAAEEAFRRVLGA